MLKSLINRDLQLILSKKTEVVQLLIFLIIVNFIFSFTLSDFAEEKKYELACSVILISQILAMNLAKRWIFERDYEIRILQQIYLSKATSTHIISAKILSNFLCFGLPVALFAPVSTLFFNLEIGEMQNILLCSVISALIISIINVMLSTITIGLRNGGIISIILSVPLLMPVVILFFSFLTANEPNYENLFSGSLGLGILFYILAIFAGNIGLALAAED